MAFTLQNGHQPGKNLTACCAQAKIDHMAGRSADFYVAIAAWERWRKDAHYCDVLQRQSFARARRPENLDKLESMSRSFRIFLFWQERVGRQQ
jgi:hypothetical protein